MAKRQIFYSFHYDVDVFRVQQIRNISPLEENKPVPEDEWKTVKRGGDSAIKKWIEDTMKYRSCVIVLIGSETANRPWIKYEIERAWRDDKALFGIYIHNLNCPNTSKCYQGKNPFDLFNFTDNQGDKWKIKVYNPNSNDAYNDIRNNIEDWVEDAIAERNDIRLCPIIY
jgi:hypothetical protein